MSFGCFSILSMFTLYISNKFYFSITALIDQCQCLPLRLNIKIQFRNGPSYLSLFHCRIRHFWCILWAMSLRSSFRKYFHYFFSEMSLFECVFVHLWFGNLGSVLWQFWLYHLSLTECVLDCALDEWLDVWLNALLDLCIRNMCGIEKVLNIVFGFQIVFET